MDVGKEKWEELTASFYEATEHEIPTKTLTDVFGELLEANGCGSCHQGRPWEGDCMGIYLDPGNSGFQRIVNSEYVDKTGLIRHMNEAIGTVNSLICISRPRRFGKSYAAQMLCAYYDCSCDSRGLFDDKEIAGTEGYLKHLNQYHVVNLDITGFISEARRQGLSLAGVPMPSWMLSTGN